MDFLTWVKYQWDRAAAGAAFVLGLVALLLGYLGISSTGFPAEQLPYIISGGIFGLFLLGTAGVLYLSADLRDEWRKLDEIDATLKAVGLPGSTLDEPALPAEPARPLAVAAMAPVETTEVTTVAKPKPARTSRARTAGTPRP